MASKKSIDRNEAIKIISNEISKHLTHEERLSHLEMIKIDWYGIGEEMDQDDRFDVLYRKTVSKDVRQKIHNGKFNYHGIKGFTNHVFDHPMYDGAVSCILQSYNDNYTNEYLLSVLNYLGLNVSEVVGEAPKRFSCPCCGVETLSERHGWNICRVCQWEDDGTDNAEASLFYSGPNKGLQLTTARILFILTGKSNPNEEHPFDELGRVDGSNPIDRFNQTRFFEIDAVKEIIFEKNSDWYAPLNRPTSKKVKLSPKLVWLEPIFVIGLK